ncbi:MAG: hypothetical protein HYU56_02350 [Candidatus Aenigmarchaeota archaeon]|nr:hypothetical protein [Candidatus Aenigmarchaeota archaeon]
MGISHLRQEIMARIDSDPVLLRHSNGDRWNTIREMEKEFSTRLHPASDIYLRELDITYDTRRSDHERDIAAYNMTVEAVRKVEDPHALLKGTFDYLNQTKPPGQVTFQVYWDTDGIKGERSLNGLGSGVVRIRANTFNPEIKPRTESKKYRKGTEAGREIDGQEHHADAKFQRSGWSLSLAGYYFERYRTISEALKPTHARVRLSKADAERFVEHYQRTGHRLLAWSFKKLLQPKGGLDGIIDSVVAKSFGNEPEISYIIPYTSVEVYENVLGKSLTDVNAWTRVTELSGMYGLYDMFNTAKRLADVKLAVQLLEDLKPPLTYGHSPVNEQQARLLVEEEIKFLEAAYKAVPGSADQKMESFGHDTRLSILYSLMEMQFGEQFMKDLDIASLHLRGLKFLKSHGFSPKRKYKEDLPYLWEHITFYMFDFFKERFAADPSRTLKEYASLYKPPEKPEIIITGRREKTKSRNLALPKNAKLGLVEIERESSSDLARLSTKHGWEFQPATDDPEEVGLLLCMGLHGDGKLLPLHDRMLRDFGIEVK